MLVTSNNVLIGVFTPNKDSLQRCVICHKDLYSEEDVAVFHTDPDRNGEKHPLHLTCLNELAEHCLKQKCDLECPSCRLTLKNHISTNIFTRSIPYVAVAISIATLVPTLFDFIDKVAPMVNLAEHVDFQSIIFLSAPSATYLLSQLCQQNRSLPTSDDREVIRTARLPWNWLLPHRH